MLAFEKRNVTLTFFKKVRVIFFQRHKLFITKKTTNFGKSKLAKELGISRADYLKSYVSLFCTDTLISSKRSMGFLMLQKSDPLLFLDNLAHINASRIMIISSFKDALEELEMIMIHKKVLNVVILTVPKFVVFS